MPEYTGYLNGGPADGNTLTTALTRVSVKSETIMYPDGEGEDKTCKVIITQGYYDWNLEKERFDWSDYSTAWFTRRPEGD